MKLPYKILTAGALALALACSGVSAPTAEAAESCRIPASVTRIAAWAEHEHDQETVSVENYHITDEPKTGLVPVNRATDAQEAPTMRYLGTYKITGYDTCAACCGKTDGITASGTQATVGRTCAASKDLPFGTRLYIEGIGERIVEDRGGAITGNRIDVLCEDHPACYAITGYYDVYVLED